MISQKRGASSTREVTLVVVTVQWGTVALPIEFIISVSVLEGVACEDGLSDGRAGDLGIRGSLTELMVSVRCGLLGGKPFKEQVPLTHVLLGLLACHGKFLLLGVRHVAACFTATVIVGGIVLMVLIHDAAIIDIDLFRRRM